MKDDFLNVIGLMTGTSMDGIDISLVKTNGVSLKRLNKNYFYKYSDYTKKNLLNILTKDINFNVKRKNYLDELITLEHFKALKEFEIIQKCDLIGFHGQTIYHNPEEKSSIQLGDPQKLARLCKKDIVFEFRSKDIEMGGQGAPLAPIYHKLIIENLNLNLPSCILNIGGIANLTYWDGNILIGFDTGPGNALMDDYAREFCNQDFDLNGSIASEGIPNKKIIKEFINNKYFIKSPPKSLDRNTFKKFYDQLLTRSFSSSDTMATLAEFTIETIKIGIKSLPKRVNNLIVTGGGYRNTYIMKKLVDKLDTKIISENDININFDFVESELIAFLSVRSIKNLPLTFPSTTGISMASSGGQIYRYS